MPKQGINDLFMQAIEAKVFELRHPKPGFRHQRNEKIVRHRFPVKDGLCARDVIRWTMSGQNPVFDALSSHAQARH